MKNALGRIAFVSGVVAIMAACSSPSQPPAATGQAASGSSSASKAGGAAVNDPRAKLVSAPTRAIGRISYSTAGSAVRDRLGLISKAAQGIPVTTHLSAVSVRGSEVGGVASLAVPPSMARSKMFQDQFIVQLMNGLTKTSRAPKFIRVQGRPVAVLSGHVAMAGWFQGHQAFVLTRESGQLDVPSLVAAVMAEQPPRT